MLGVTAGSAGKAAAVPQSSRWDVGRPGILRVTPFARPPPRESGGNLGRLRAPLPWEAPWPGSEAASRLLSGGAEDRPGRRAADAPVRARGRVAGGGPGRPDRVRGSLNFELYLQGALRGSDQWWIGHCDRKVRRTPGRWSCPGPSQSRTVGHDQAAANHGFWASDRLQQRLQGARCHPSQRLSRSLHRAQSWRVHA